MKRFLLVLLGTLSFSACGQQPSAAGEAQAAAPAAVAAAPAPAQIETVPGTPADRARKLIESFNAEVAIDHIGQAPMPGFQEVIVAGQVLYVSDDGRYLLQGTVYDAQVQKDVSQSGMNVFRREALAEVPKADRIIFAPARPAYTVSVFTDVECTYCRRLHQEIAEYNKLGIAVEYIAFPRMGPGTEDFAKMVSVWCSADRRKAMTDAKGGKRVPAATCDNPVAQHYDLGQRVGVTGTPMIVAADGTRMAGYLPPDALLATLKALEADAAAGAGGGR